ncbi:MAG TPA: ABC transporter substrate-binding protein, partial [Anaerolineales bacterium]
DLQSKINELNATLATLPTTGTSYLQTVNDVKSVTANLNQTNTAIAKAQSRYDSAMDAARQALYALTDAGEPRLGTWQSKSNSNRTMENDADLHFPFGHPSFNRIVYQFYPSEDAALADFKSGKVDSILEQNGLSAQSQSTLGNSYSRMESPALLLHFLVFNDSNPALNDPALHQALTCILDTKAFANQAGNADALASFVALDEKFWNNPGAALPCNGLDSTSRRSQTIQILENAGYKWNVLPSPSSNGQGFTLPTGNAFPAINLMVSSSEPQENNAGNTIRQQFTLLGIPLTIESVNSDDLRYAVFSSHQYDMAILGWNVSEYPGYLCDWFKDGNPFGYQSDSLKSACEALNSTSDLTTAQKDIYQVQSILAQDLPFIPLYSGITYDAYRNIKYPFDRVLGGLSGVYGAPSLAIPAP